MPNSSRYGVGPRNPAPLRPIAKPILPDGAVVDRPAQNTPLIQNEIDRAVKCGRVNLLQEVIDYLSHLETLPNPEGSDSSTFDNGYDAAVVDIRGFVHSKLERENA